MTVKTIIRDQFLAFGRALTFLTRLPCPGYGACRGEDLAGAVVYFPLVGLLIGLFGGVVFRVALFFLPASIAVLLALALITITTGAMHEDGFADVCDSFGVFTAERKLAVMHDSRLGTFGVMGLIFLVCLKIAALLALPTDAVFWALVCAHGISRWVALVAAYAGPQKTADSSMANFMDDLVTTRTLLVSAALPGLILLIRFGASPMLSILGLGILTGTVSARYFTRHLGSVTGDCMGAIIQLMELFCFILLVGFAK